MRIRAVLFAVSTLCLSSLSAAEVFPGEHWATRKPEEVGLSAPKLEALSRLVGGRGCVVRRGYLAYSWGDTAKSGDVASAVKPLISHLLLTAVQERLVGSVDDPVSTFQPALNDLPPQGGAPITWRHLASQTSGYGLAEPAGAAWAYNDFALALYYDTLMGRVYRNPGTDVLRTRLAEVLQFEDPYTFEAFGPADRPGRLAVSVRDFARFGLLYLRGGRWKDRQVLDPELLEMALSSPVPAGLPRTGEKEAPMLSGQRSLGGGKNITPVGPGLYSFNWWLNRLDEQGRRLYPGLPPDAYVASGHGGKRTLWVIPSLDLIVCWNDSQINDHDRTPGNPDSMNSRAARLIAESVIPRRTRIEIRGADWYIDGRVTYPQTAAQGLLMNIRMVNSTFEDRHRTDFDSEANTNSFLRWLPDYAVHGVRAFTLNLQGGMPGYEGAWNSAFHADGRLRESYLARIRRVIEACDEYGIAVILGCFYQRQDQYLESAQALRRAVQNTARWIQKEGFTNVMLEIANEHDHRGFDYPLIREAAGQVELMQLARRVHPGLLVSTSGLGHGRIDPRIAAAADFVLIHFNGTPVEEIASRAEVLRPLRKPVVCNEDDKIHEEGAASARASVQSGISWGYMYNQHNQYQPFIFRGHHDDPAVYEILSELTGSPKH